MEPVLWSRTLSTVAAINLAMLGGWWFGGIVALCGVLVVGLVIGIVAWIQ